MKKLAICALSALILISSLAGCGAEGSTASPTPDPSASPSASAAPLAEYDWAGAWAKYDPETVVMTVNGEDVTWDEYFYWLYREYIEIGYGNELSYYIDNAGMTLDEFLFNDVEYFCLQYHVLPQQADILGIELTEEDQAVLDEQLASDIEHYAGEDGTEEEMYEALADIYVTRDVYETVNRMAVLYPRVFMSLYGASGEQISDEEALAFAEEYNFVTAKHILFRTTDDSGNDLSDAEKEEKRSQAQAALDELNAVPESERAALFDAIMEERSEDPGLASYPDGYSYEAGVGIMMSEFDDAVLDLEPGGISGIVESPSGYHIIMRESVGPDTEVMLSATDVYPLRYACAVYNFNEQFVGWMDDAEVVYSSEFENFLPSSLFE